MSKNNFWFIRLLLIGTLCSLLISCSKKNKTDNQQGGGTQTSNAVTTYSNSDQLKGSFLAYNGAEDANNKSRYYFERTWNNGDPNFNYSHHTTIGGYSKRNTTHNPNGYYSRNIYVKGLYNSPRNRIVTYQNISYENYDRRQRRKGRRRVNSTSKKRFMKMVFPSPRLKTLKSFSRTSINYRGRMISAYKLVYTDNVGQTFYPDIYTYTYVVSPEIPLMANPIFKGEKGPNGYAVATRLVGVNN